MTLEEKWGIVYASALQGAGDGVVMALAIILGIMVLFALVAAIVAFLCPECIAAIAGFLSTVVWGAAVRTWLAAGYVVGSRDVEDSSLQPPLGREIGRESCRERVCQYG